MQNNEYLIEQTYSKYTKTDQIVWSTLFNTQQEILKNRACDEFLQGLNSLKLDSTKIPNFQKLNELLAEYNWSVIGVTGLIPSDMFFKMLSERKFPVAVWIRNIEDLEYLEEPDLFHDLYGHLPLLTDPFFSDFVQIYGQKGLEFIEAGINIEYLARLYWYTVEFGLINNDNQLKIYGSGIVSSSKESVYCLEDKTPQRIKFNLKRVLSTQNIISDVQNVYFVIENYEELVNAINQDLIKLCKEIKTEFHPKDVCIDDERIII